MNLKPCPFCGGEPRFLKFKPGFYEEKVICDTCHFSIAAGYMRSADVWNTRSAPPEEQARARWVPVSSEIAMTRINEVTIGLPIFGHDQEGQWYRLDCEPRINERQPQGER